MIYRGSNGDYHTGWWLSHPSEKKKSSSIGMITFPTNGKIESMFQTPNQDINISSGKLTLTMETSPFLMGNTAINGNLK